MPKEYLSNHKEETKGGDSGTGRAEPHGIGTYLKEETDVMAYERRGLEQAMETQWGKVNERRRPQRNQDNGPVQGNHLKQHPLLNIQRFDGIDSNLNPSPLNSQEALIEAENELREQEKEKQLRKELQLGNTPENNPAYSRTPRMTRG